MQDVTASDGQHCTRVWDIAVRVFHWALVLALVFQFYSGKVGGNVMEWHLRAGYAVLALVLFRLLWGFGGSDTARFSFFLAGPRKAFAYGRSLLSPRPARYASHNPLGAWMVVALLASLGLQAATGLFANDDIATEGPLAALVSKSLSDRLTGIHQWNAYVLVVLVVLHVTAVAYHAVVKREDLVRAMFTGVKSLPAEVAAELVRSRFASPWRAAVFLGISAAAVFLIVRRPFFS